MLEEILGLIREAGAVAVGAVAAGVVPEGVREEYERWTGEGRHAGMEYLERYPEVRFDSRRLLEGEGARTIICCAFGFSPAEERNPALGRIAAYAYGDDYHDAIRKRLTGVTEALKAEYGGEWRICIDTAPVLERYWAVQAGIGEIGENGCLMVPGIGGMVFLAEIVTDLDFIRDKGQGTRDKICLHCGACRRACPAGALGADGHVDARRCLSYLTIEHRGEWDEVGREAMRTPLGRQTLYGCDACLRACPVRSESISTPHSSPLTPHPSLTLPEFRLREDLKKLDYRDIAQMPQEEFSRIFRGSAIKRAKLAGLRRNAANME